MSDVIRALFATVTKMFFADLWLTIAALATVALCAAGVRSGWLRADVAPFLLAAGVLVALVAGVIHGARR